MTGLQKTEIFQRSFVSDAILTPDHLQNIHIP